MIKIKEMVDSRQLGKLYYIYSTRVNLGRVQRDLNALWSIAPHDISILLFLLEAMPVEISARGGSYLNHGIEDVAFLDLCFPQGVIAHIHVSWLDPSKVRRLTLVGSEKMAVYDDLDNESKIKIYDKGVQLESGDIFGEFHYRLHDGDIYSPSVSLAEPLALECAHFLECVREGKEPRSGGESGIRVVRVLEAAQRSLDKGGVPITLPEVG